MNYSRNAWIIFVVGIVFIGAEWILPEFDQQYTVQIPMNNFGAITIIGPLGVTLVILSVVKILGYIPSWEQMFSNRFDEI